MSISVGGYNHHPGYIPAGFPCTTADFYPSQYQPSRYDQQSGDSYMSWMLAPGHGHSEQAPIECGEPYGTSPADICRLPQYDFYGNLIQFRGVKRRVTANKKERRRTESINSAFAQLRGCIPNVPSDTKLSKIKTLRLATSYISYLMDLLSKDDPVLENVFKADLHRKKDRRTEADVSVKTPQDDQKPRDLHQYPHQHNQSSQQPHQRQHTDSSDSNSDTEKRTKGRTGWPQTVWASELK